MLIPKKQKDRFGVFYYKKHGEYVKNIIKNGLLIIINKKTHLNL